MKAIKALSLLIILLVIAAWVITQFTIIYVPMGKVGVRTNEYALFGEKGVVKQDFASGWHRDIGLFDTWTLFDSTVQTLEMTRDPARGSVRGQDDVKVRSADGYAVSVDVTVKYRISAGQAHKLYQNTGGGEKYKSIVRNQSQKTCIEIFGEMSTEDFYNPLSRRTKADNVKTLLAENLQNNYVEVIDVLIRDVQFDPEYENKIRRKKLADQEVELNKSMGAAAQMRGKTEVIVAETERKVKIITKEKEAELVRMEAETDRKIATITAEAKKYADQKRADADIVVARKGAEGLLLVKNAEAEGERLRNRAMMGVGGSTLVALEAARNLNLADLTISTIDVDLLDLDAMADKLGASAVAK